ncbi:MAG: hypothetical protein APF77_16055 [Clostridia bacterium BRH_c25]|nr:MAG: hypothetical protein APF77_16055 [Clostridia bacterium BRH_c25]
MKHHITIENLMELSEYQRDRLNDLWTPQRYDLAAGFLCKDAENNEYDVFEFVLGHVSIKETGSGYYMTLMNLEALRSWGAQEDTAEEEADMEEYSEEDFIFEYERPDVYSKGDCMPLLNIGQMLEILNKCGYGGGNFYVNFRKGNNDWAIGRDIEQYIDYGTDYNEEELCDVLWTAVKEAI